MQANCYLKLKTIKLGRHFQTKSHLCSVVVLPLHKMVRNVETPEFEPLLLITKFCPVKILLFENSCSALRSVDLLQCSSCNCTRQIHNQWRRSDPSPYSPHAPATIVVIKKRYSNVSSSIFSCNVNISHVTKIEYIYSIFKLSRTLSY